MSINNITYPKQFYETLHAESLYAANIILDKVLALLPRVQTAVDVGCGVGTWLSVLRKEHAVNVQGIDGPWVPSDFLQIPHEDFFAWEFDKQGFPSYSDLERERPCDLFRVCRALA